MQTVLVDTDVAIDFLRGVPYANDLVLQLWEENAAYLSVLSIYELYAGMRGNEKKSTEAFIDACNIVPLTLDIAKKGGEMYSHYRKTGITITSIDCLIAATALMSSLKIATRNLKHYPEKGLVLKIKALQ